MPDEMDELLMELGNTASEVGPEIEENQARAKAAKVASADADTQKRTQRLYSLQHEMVNAASVTIQRLGDEPHFRDRRPDDIVHPESSGGYAPGATMTLGATDDYPAASKIMLRLNGSRASVLLRMDNVGSRISDRPHMFEVSERVLDAMHDSKEELATWTREAMVSAARLFLQKRVELSPHRRRP